MRISWIVMCAMVLAVGGVKGQEADRDAPPVASDPQPRRIFPAWRPISRWFGRSSLTGEPDTIKTPEDPVRLVSVDVPAGVAAAAPATGAPANPGTTQPGSSVGAAASGGAAGAAGAPAGAGGGAAVSSNPGAVDMIAGTGALGRLLGLGEDTGIRLGGLWIGDASGVLSGGRDPGKWGLNGLTIVDLNFDTEKIFGMTGGSFGTQFLQFSGQPTNKLAGAFPGFDSLEVTPPLVRQELYQLWYRQTLFDDKLIFRVGKMVPTFDFNNVVKPVPTSDSSAVIPAVTSLVYTPIFVNASMLGVMPTTTIPPRESRLRSLPRSRFT